MNNQSTWELQLR